MTNWKGCRSKQSLPNFKVLSQNVPRGTEENHETPQDSRSPFRDLNPIPPEYEAGLLSTRHDVQSKTSS
jgi:hypothetical protein